MIHADCELEWHGFNANGRTLSIGRLPGREQVALYLIEGSQITVLAYFRSPEKARAALRFLDYALKIRP